MYYLINVDHNGMAAHLNRSDWKILRSAVYPVQRMGMLGVSVRKMKALIGRQTESDVLCVVSASH